jgi:hypothetical protein
MKARPRMRPGVCWSRSHATAWSAAWTSRASIGALPGTVTDAAVSMNSKDIALLISATEKPRFQAISAKVSAAAPRRCVPVPGTMNTIGAVPGWSRKE